MSRAAYMREYRNRKKHPVREAKIVLDAEVERLTEANARLADANAQLAEEVKTLKQALAKRFALPPLPPSTPPVNVPAPYTIEYHPAPKPGGKKKGPA